MPPTHRRPILLQLFPWLTIWSTFCIATSRSAMWATRDSGLLGKKSPGKAKKKKNKKKKSDDASQTEQAEPSAEEEEQQQHNASADGETKVYPWLISFNAP